MPYTRDNIYRALSAGATEENKRTVLETHERRMYADTSQGPKESQWNTWCMDHMNWFKDGIATGQYVSALPLTPGKTVWAQHEHLLCQYADEHGELPTVQEDVIVMAEMLAREMGLPLVDPDGREWYGRHVWRSSGSEYMGARSIDIRIIKPSARWQSETVLSYLQEAPLKVITDTFPKADPVTVLSAPELEQLLKRKAACDKMEASVTEENDAPLGCGCAVTKFAQGQTLKMLEQVNMAEAEAQAGAMLARQSRVRSIGTSGRDRGRICVWCNREITLDQICATCQVCAAGPFHMIHLRQHRRLSHG